MARQPVWLRLDAVLATHDLLLEAPGGSPGLRDLGLLESALSRPRHLFTYEKPNLFDLAAAYAFGIARSHLFVDGNKRSAFMAAWTFLVLNGKELTMSEPEVVFAMNAIAGRDLNEKRLAQWLGKNSRGLRTPAGKARTRK